MKFDYCIGNPPYQEETDTVSEINGQTPRTNIFQYFQIEADKIATKTSVLIYPGARWIHRYGKGCKEFGLQQINSPQLKRVEFYSESKELFGQAADLSDGITIVIKDYNKTSGGFEYDYICNGSRTSAHLEAPGEELIPLNPNNLTILVKVDRFLKSHGFKTLHDRVLPRTLFGIESDFVENNPEKVRLYIDDEHCDFPQEIKVLTNDRAGKAGRARWYVANKDIIKESAVKYLHEWQVAVSSANAGGQKRDNQIQIIDNHSCFGRSRLALASFGTQEEAENFFSFCQSKIVRFLFLMTDESLASLGKKVIDIGSYDNNGLIDFSLPIDEQLRDLLLLTEYEWEYIKQTIDLIDSKRGGSKNGKK